MAPDVVAVDAIELEYAEVGELHPSTLLGELGGSRGSGQTSPDFAFLVNGGRGLVLTEKNWWNIHSIVARPTGVTTLGRSQEIQTLTAVCMPLPC